MSQDPDSTAENAPSGLEALVIECLDRLEDEGPVAIERLCGEHPDLADALRRRMQTLGRMGLLSGQEGGTDRPPERLGEFRLLQRLGAGGMGVVYVAEQESLGRRVALKLIRPEFLYFEGARDRFLREVEAIARLQHPAIVPVHAAGEERGIPYFAMEHVDGANLADVLAHLRDRRPERLSGGDLIQAIHAVAPLSAAADAAGEPALERRPWVQAVVGIVAQVADALVHAHARGVMHRDVKPSNLMLRRDGRALLLDFGLASTRGGTRITRTGAALGSLAYMSPEQLAGRWDEVDARSDVYSLGVTLYEMLALEAPFAGNDTEDVRRRVLAAEPPPLRQRNPAVPWDVETVCQKAMEPDREHRYAGMAEFARDLRRLLAAEPITARRPSALRRVGKWVQRHPTRTVASVLGFLLLVPTPALFAWTTWRKNQRIAQEAQRAEQARGQAEERRTEAERSAAEARRSAAEAEAIWRYQQRLLSSPDPTHEGRDVRVADVLDRAAQEVATAFPGQPDVEASVRATLAESYMSLGLLEAADAQFEAALRLDPGVLAGSGVRRARVQVRMAHLRQLQRRMDEAEAILDEAMAVLGSDVDGDELALNSARLELAWVRIVQRRDAEAAELVRAAGSAFARLLGPDAGQTLEAEGALAMILYRQGDAIGACEVFARVVAAKERALGPAHHDTLTTKVNYASALSESDRNEEAVRLAEEVLAVYDRTLGPDHVNTFAALGSLAVFLGRAGRYAEEEAVERRLLEARRRVLGPDHADTLRTQGNLVFTLQNLKRIEEAEDLARATLDARLGALGADDWETINSMSQLGSILTRQGRYAEAEPFIVDAVAGARAELGPEHWITGVYLSGLGECRSQLGRPDEAEPDLLEGQRVVEATLGPSHSRTVTAVKMLVAFYERHDRPEDAARWRERLGDDAP